MRSAESSARSAWLDRWRHLGVFFVANVFFGAGLFFHAFLYNFYLDALGLSESTMGAAAAALTAGGLVMLLPAGLLVDVRGSRFTYYLATGLAVTGLVAGALAQTAIAVYTAAFVAGAGTSAWRVAVGPIIMQLTDVDTRSRAFSWNVGLLVGSGGAWMALAGAAPQWLTAVAPLGALGSLRVALLLGAGGTALSAILFSLLRHGPGHLAAPVEGDARPATARHPARPGAPGVPRGLALLVLLFALWMIAPALVTPFFNIYFQRTHGLALGSIGLIFAMTHLVTAAVIFGSGELASRLGPSRTLALWVVLFGPMLWGLATGPVLSIAVALYLMQGMVSPATNPLIDQILLERAPDGRLGAVSSWRNAATEVSGIVGASVGGVVLEVSSFAVLFVAAGLAGVLAAVVLLLALMRPAKAPTLGGVTTET